MNEIVYTSAYYKLRITSSIYDFMPNLEDNVANLSDFTGLCTVLVSLFLELAVWYHFQCRMTYFSSRIGPFMASTRPYFLFLVDMS